MFLDLRNILIIADNPAFICPYAAIAFKKDTSIFETLLANIISPFVFPIENNGLRFQEVNFYQTERNLFARIGLVCSLIRACLQ